MEPDMHTEDDPQPAAPDSAAPKPRGGNRRTLIFVSIFAFSVFGLLTGYRFLIGTLLNDWYLFRVASDTVSALTLIGDSATLENLPGILQLDSRMVRASLEAWDRGEAEPAQDAIKNAPAGPLETWERYRYRIEKIRRGPPGRAIGPHVSFVLKPGTSTELQAAENELTQALGRGDAENPVKKAEMDALRERVHALREQMRSTPKKDGGEKVEAYRFSFYVVSECGAIEVMAIFFSAVIAFPTTWRKRAIGLAGGLPMMYGLNIFRLSLLAVIGALDNGGPWFEFAHEYLWQAVYIVFVVVVWMVWIEVIVRGRK
jgi:exosortase/archaeosortase family protein